MPKTRWSVSASSLAGEQLLGMRASMILEHTPNSIDPPRQRHPLTDERGETRRWICLQRRARARPAVIIGGRSKKSKDGGMPFSRL
jgi:hypothetical protein